MSITSPALYYTTPLSSTPPDMYHPLKGSKPNLYETCFFDTQLEGNGYDEPLMQLAQDNQTESITPGTFYLATNCHTLKGMTLQSIKF